MPYAPTPLLSSYEGQLTTGTEWFPFSFSQPAIVSRIRVNVQFPSPSVSTVSLLKNSAVVATATIPASGSDSGNFDFTAVSYSTSDVLKLRCSSASDDDPPSAVTVQIFYASTTGSAAGPYYSDPIDEVKSHLRMIGIGSAESDSLTDAQVIARQARTDRFIDARLRAVYYTPFIAVERAGDTRYPDPIPEIARRHCAGSIVMDLFTDVEPNKSESAKSYIDWAEAELIKILNPEYRLEGQRLKPRNYGSDPYTEPLTPINPSPTTPARQ